MTAEIINLNKARKARERAEKGRRAEENRVRYGRTKAEREQEDAQRELDTRRHDGAQRGGYPGSGTFDDDFDPGNAS